MTSLAAALVLLLPVITRLPSMARWIWSLLIHNQRYGGGEVGLPSVATMRSNLNAIYGGEPFLFYTVIFFALVYVLLSLVPYRHEEQVQSTRMLLLVAVLANALQIVMTVKHCAPHYIVPALMLTPIVIAGITALLLKSTVLHRSLRAALAVALAALVASGLLYNGYRLRSWSAQFESYRSELARTERAAQAKIEGSDCLRVGYYRSSLPEFALSFGSDLSGRSQGSVLEELYPDAVYYSRGQFYAFPGRPCLEKVVNRVRKGGCVLLQGEALPVGSTVVGFTRETIAAGLHEVIYRLGVGSLASGPVVPQIHLPDGSIVIDALKFTAGNVVRDSTDFGVGLGVIRSSIMPSFAEYEIPIPSAGPYEVAIRYATEELRPVTIRLNGEMSGTSVCTDTTSGYNPANQLWQSAGDFSFKTGANVLRIESAGPFPHISKLAIIPKKNRP
jgi:hypothetical protein